MKNPVFWASVLYPTVPYPTVLLDRSQNNISKQHWFYPISNHFAESNAKLSNHFIWFRQVKISYRFWFIQPFFRDIQPFGLIQTHIQPLPVYLTVFPRYPTIFWFIQPRPSIWLILDLSNLFSKISNHLDWIKLISHCSRFIQLFFRDFQPFGSL